MTLTEQDLAKIHEIAIKLFHKYPTRTRDLLLFEALQTYLINNKIEPGFKVKE